MSSATGTDPSPPEVLADAVARVLEQWIVNSVVATATAVLGECPQNLVQSARDQARENAPRILAELSALLATDVDDQRETPLGVLRRAVEVPTRVLAAADVPARRRDSFASEAFPDDVYGLVPASWADIDASLHEPGIIWGAWKAKTVLDRRRAEGRR